MTAAVVAAEAANHELLQAFARRALPLCQTLTEMLNEHSVHRSERRGCGFTQATRFAAALVNQPALPPLPGGGLLRPATERRRGGRAALLENIRHESGAILADLQRSESRLLARLLLQLALRDGEGIALGPATPQKLPIGTCPLAEQYFLEIAYDSIRRGGTVNVVVADDGTPLLIEKCGLGDNHSSISVAPVVLNGVALPVGSLVGIERDAQHDAACPATRNGRGRIIAASSLRSVRFLRLTTLAVSPQDRARAFSAHFEQQLRGDLFSPDSTGIERLIAFAAAQLS